MNLSPAAARILSALLYGIGAFLIIYLISRLFVMFTPLVDFGSMLKRIAPILGLLFGLLAYFSNNRLIH